MTEFRIDVVVDPAQVRPGARAAIAELGKVEASAEQLSKALLHALEMSGIPKSLRSLEQVTRSLRALEITSNQVAMTQERTALATESLAAAQAREALAAQQAAGANRALGDAAAMAGKGVDGMTKEVEELGNETEKAKKKAFDFKEVLGKALAFVGIAIGIQQLVEMTDAFSNIQNRLRTVTEDEVELARVTKELGDISNRTRSSFQATAELYARVGLSAKELGRTQDELLQFTESLNQAITLSGASATEAQAGLIQLSQGLASGALRGDELRSVLEQLPAVADVIAKELGVTRGELRKMGQDGKITADIVIDAFKHAREELGVKFAETLPTLGQSATVLRNKFIEFIGSLNQATGASSVASGALLLIADNLRVVTVAASALATVVLVQMAQKAIPALIVQLTALKATVLANPLFLAAGGAAVGITLLITRFADLNKQIEDCNAALKDVETEAAFSEFGKLGDQVLKTRDAVERMQKVVERDPDNALAVKKLAEFRAELERLEGKSKEYVDAAKKAKVAQDELKESFEGALANLEREAGLLAMSNAERDVQNKLFAIESKLKKDKVELSPDQRLELEGQLRLNQSLEAQNKVLEEIRGPEAERLERLATLRQLLDQGRISQEEFNKAAATQVEEQGPVAPKELPEFDVPKGFQFIPPPDEFQKALDQLREESKLIALTNEERTIQSQLLAIEQQLRSQGRTLSDEEKVALEEQLRLNQAANEEMRIRQKLLEDILGPEKAAQEQIAQLKVLMDAGTISSEQYDKQLEKIQGSLAKLDQTAEGGFKSGLADAHKELEDLSSLASNVVTNGFGAAEDAVAEFARTGKANVSDLVDSVLADITKLLARQALLGLFGGTEGGGLLGSIFGGALQAGGDVDPSKAYLVGEKGPELFVPTGAGSVMPSDATQAMIEAGGSRGGTTVVTAPAPVVNVKVENYSDPKEALDALDSPEGTQKVVNIIRKNPNAIRRS